MLSPPLTIIFFVTRALYLFILRDYCVQKCGNWGYYREMFIKSNSIFNKFLPSFKNICLYMYKGIQNNGHNEKEKQAYKNNKKCHRNFESQMPSGTECISMKN